MAKAKPTTKSDNVSFLDVQPTDGATAIDAPKTKNDALSHLDSAEMARFAVSLAVDLSGSVDDRLDAAALHIGQSQRHMIACGVLLLSIKSQTEHGRFADLLTERGFGARAAQRAMQYAEFILSRPDADRDALIGLHKSKVLALASADPEVIDVILKDGAYSIDTLSVQALHQRIRDLEAATTELTVQRDTAEAESTGLRKKLDRSGDARDDGTPVVIADMRAEVMASHKKADLAVAAIRRIAVEVGQLIGADAVHPWCDATLRLIISTLCALRLRLDGEIDYLRNCLPDGALVLTPPLAHLTRQEMLEAAQAFEQLTLVDSYERQLRAWEREKDRPQGKGRPKSKPVEPKANPAGPKAAKPARA